MRDPSDTYMIRAIDQLARDHRNMRQILDIIDEEMQVYREGGTPDFDLLRLIVDYSLNYPELVHHPREDVILHCLTRRDPAGAAAVGDLVSEHRKLSELTHRLAAAIANAGRDAVMPRSWLEDMARDYSSRLRTHMADEERSLFGRALAVLTDEDWADVEARTRELDDPLFGGKVADDYLRLHQRILRLHV